MVHEYYVLDLPTASTGTDAYSRGCASRAASVVGRNADEHLWCAIDGRFIKPVHVDI
jgi:hypothetical protein